MIDAAKYGRNESYLLINDQRLVQADTLNNLTFSWNIWDLGIEAKRIQNIIDKA
jgi:hypothetical protein